MTTKRVLSTVAVIEAATALVDEEGVDSLSLSRVARELHVKPPSLYNHVDGLEALRRGIALRASEDVGTQVGKASMGRAGRSALRAVADELRAYAAAHPALYELMAQIRVDDQDFATASLQALEPVIAVIRGFDLPEDEVIHAARTLRASLHGFVSIESAGGFGLDVDIDASFEWMVESLADNLESASDNS